MHVGWRGASKKPGSSGGSGEHSAWGHWEALGSGPIKGPLARQQSSLESDVDPKSLTLDPVEPPCQTNEPTSDTECGTLASMVQATLATFDCVDKKSRRPCPKLEDCCDTERRVSDDNFSDLKGVDVHSKEPELKGNKVNKDGDLPACQDSSPL